MASRRRARLAMKSIVRGRSTAIVAVAVTPAWRVGFIGHAS